MPAPSTRLAVARDRQGNTQRTRFRQRPFEEETGLEGAVLPTRRRACLLHQTLRRSPVLAVVAAGRPIRPAFLLLLFPFLISGSSARVLHKWQPPCLLPPPIPQGKLDSRCVHQPTIRRSP